MVKALLLKLKQYFVAIYPGVSPEVSQALWTIPITSYVVSLPMPPTNSCRLTVELWSVSNSLKRFSAKPYVHISKEIHGLRQLKHASTIHTANPQTKWLRMLELIV